MRVRPRRERGFTLVELIAAVLIIAILAAVVLERESPVDAFQERGYADVVAANLRQARAVALASRCDVQFTIDDDGYRALQRSLAGNRCAPAPAAFQTPLLAGNMPAGVVLATSRQFVFSGDDGRIGGAVVITLGQQTLTVDGSGVLR